MLGNKYRVAFCFKCPSAGFQNCMSSSSQDILNVTSTSTSSYSEMNINNQLPSHLSQQQCDKGKTMLILKMLIISFSPAIKQFCKQREWQTKKSISICLFCSLNFLVKKRMVKVVRLNKAREMSQKSKSTGCSSRGCGFDSYTHTTSHNHL